MAEVEFRSYNTKYSAVWATSPVIVPSGQTEKIITVTIDQYSLYYILIYILYNNIGTQVILNETCRSVHL